MSFKKVNISFIYSLFTEEDLNIERATSREASNTPVVVGTLKCSGLNSSASQISTKSDIASIKQRLDC